MKIGPTITLAANRLDADAQERTAREALVDRYCDLQPQLQKHLSSLVYGEAQDDMHAVTEHQRVVLGYLRGQSVTMRELAKRLGVGESAATAVVERLVRQGLVVRHDDPTDRRLVRLALSDQGEFVVAELSEKSRQRIAGLLAVLSDDQLTELVGIMETLEASAKEQIGARCSATSHANDHKENP